MAGKGKNRKKDKKDKQKKRERGASHKHETLQKASKKDWKEAMREYNKNTHHLSVRAIARKYGIPESTFQHRVSDRAHLGASSKTLGGYRKPRIIPAGEYTYIYIIHKHTDTHTHTLTL
jgi:hypothetical protein